jgi:Tfp pilus assembly protein PilX
MQLKFLQRFRQVRRDQRGFTMAPVVIAGTLITLMVASAVAAVNGDLNLTRNDLDQKQAYEAAKAGINDYAYHLNSDTNYWTQCTGVPAPNAVNQMGSTAKRRPVPGTTGSEYAIELLPATGKPACNPADAAGSMIETTGTATGTFRIRSTGYSGDSQQSVVATFKRASFLDYVYFTQYETSDPVTYGDAGTVAAATTACEKWIRDGRITPSGSREYCNVIVFGDDDEVNGPLHTNDELVTCGDPQFGRTTADEIEVSAPPRGWNPSSGFGCWGAPDFNGTFETNQPVLTPPPTNSQLKTVAQAAYRFSGQVYIHLDGQNVTVASSNGQDTMPMPSNGVIYVSNSTTQACSTAYSPFTASYPTSSGCGNVYIDGSYSKKLTIAAENDIIVTGNINRATDGLLGLIANNFVRVYHPYPTQTSEGNCGSGSGEQRLLNLQIDAAILAIQHSFIVDHYNCGSNLGTLTVNGAISQKFRGPVGLTSTPGYTKNYNYDDRLRYYSPPYFLDPVESAWHVQRETLDFP